MLAPYSRAELGGELRAIAYKVVVEPEPEPERLVAVVKSQEDSFRVGRVVSVGKVAAEKIPELEPGLRVLYAQGHSCTTAVEGRHIVHHDHVLCVVEGEGRLEARSNADPRATEVRFDRQVAR